jgi:hypothetical protein
MADANNKKILEALKTYVGSPMSVNKVYGGQLAHIQPLVVKQHLLGVRFDMHLASQWVCNTSAYPFEQRLNWLYVESDFGYFTARASFNSVTAFCLSFHAMFHDDTIALCRELPYLQDTPRGDRIRERSQHARILHASP